MINKTKMVVPNIIPFFYVFSHVFYAYFRLGQEGYKGTLHDYNPTRAIDIEGITRNVV